jgi:cationic peptide transport system ATP-binding protein
VIEPSLLQVRGLCKTYQNRTGLFRRRAVEAIKPLSFDLEVGQTLAIVGEAGSGKSTLARILAGMIEPSGEIAIEGQPMIHGDYQTRCKLLRMIFQTPTPPSTARSGSARSWRPAAPQHRDERGGAPRQGDADPAHGGHAGRPRPLLSADALRRQQQRVALARALILNPKIVVADEALSTLDISVRSQIINLLLEMQETMG